MKKLVLYIILYSVVQLYSHSISGQVVANLKLGYLGIHPGENLNADLYENALVPAGTIVVEPSVWIGLEYFMREDYLSFQVYQGFLSDAAARSAGFTFVGFKRRFWRVYRSSFYIEFGTSFSFRQNWNTLAGYIPEKNYDGSGKWQTKWIYFSGGIDYYFYLTKKHDLSLSAFYGHYDKTFTFTLGYRYWFSTVFKHPKPCKCPFDKYDKKYKRNH